jgi:hypothetical protein
LIGLSTRPRRVEIDGRERFVSEHAKTIVTVDGDRRAEGSHSAVTQPFGLALELVPLMDPARLRPGDQLALRLRRDAGSAAGVEVAIEHPGGSVSNHAADAGGHVVVTLEEPGRYCATARDEVMEGDALHARAASLTFDVGGVR